MWSRSVEDLVDQVVGEDMQLHLQATVSQLDGKVRDVMMAWLTVPAASGAVLC